jgi:hypothetical protein
VTNLLRNKNNRSAAIQFLFLLANAIARLCFQEYQLRRRIDELTAVYNVAMMLSRRRATCQRASADGGGGVRGDECARLRARSADRSGRMSWTSRR